jgi:MFS transporter, DHA1 family, multidrug resistance protein
MDAYTVATNRAISSSQTLATLRRTIFFVSLPFFILNLMLPVYGKQIGASVVEIGLFFSVFSLVTVLLRPLIGWGLDRFGRRVFFIAGVGGYAVTMIGFASIDQVWGILAARILQGIAASLLWLAATAIVADVASEHGRGQAFGGVTQATSQGSIVGTFLGFFLLNSHISGLLSPLSSWMVLFLIYGAISFAALFLALRRLPETRLARIEVNQTPIQWSQTWVLLLLMTLVTAASVAMISPILIIFLQEKLGVGVETLAWAFLPAGLVWALLPAYLGKQADRFGRKPMLLLGLVAAAASSFFIPGLGSILALAAVWAFQEVCYAAADPAQQALVADLTGEEQRGRAYGLYVMCAGLGATIGPLGGAWLYQAYGAQAPFYANGIILALCAVVVAVFLKIPPKVLS